MRPLAILLALTLLISTASAQQTRPVEETRGDLKFGVVDHFSLSDQYDNFPLLSAGAFPQNITGDALSVPTQFTWGALPLDDTHRITGLLNSGGKLGPAIANRAVSFLIAAPKLNVRQSVIPTRLTRDGKTLHIGFEVWTPADGGEAGKNFDRRLACLLTIGALPVGKYDVLVTLDYLQGDAGNRYTSAGLRETAHTVFEATADGSAPAVTIPLKELQKEAFDAKSVPRFPPIYASRASFGVAQAKPSVTIGKLDGVKFIARPPARPMELPAPEMPAPGQAVASDELYAAIVSPILNSGETLVLDSIVATNDSCTLNVTLWRDSGGRSRNALSNTVLLVPLSYLKKGENTVTVKWQENHARNILSPYTPLRDPPVPETKTKMIIE